MLQQALTDLFQHCNAVAQDGGAPGMLRMHQSLFYERYFSILIELFVIVHEQDQPMENA